MTHTHVSITWHLPSPPFSLTVTWLCWVAAVAHGIFAVPRGIAHSCSARILGLWLAGFVFPCGRWGPSSLTRKQTRICCTAKQTPNHWTTREVPPSISKEIISSQSGRCTVPLFLLFSIWCKPGFCPHHFREMVPPEVTVTSLVTPVCLLLTMLEFGQYGPCSLPWNPSLLLLLGTLYPYGSSLSPSISSLLSYLQGFYPPCTSSLWISAKRRTQMTLLWVSPL